MAVEDAPSYAELQREKAALRRELAEAREREAEGLAREAATSEILRVISSSPTDLRPVLDTIAESAARLCTASDVSVFRVQGGTLRQAAGIGPVAELLLASNHALPLSRGSASGRAVVERRIMHEVDLAEVVDTELPDSRL